MRIIVIISSSLNVGIARSLGIWKKNCRYKSNHQAHYFEEKEESEHLCFACQAITKEEKLWFIDSGCSNYMASNESIFIDLDFSVKTKIKMGNGDLVESKGKGTVAISTKKCTKFIKDVLLVPSFDQNLLSVGQMMENSYSLCFENNLCGIYDEKNKVELAELKIGRSRNFHIQRSFPNAMVTTMEDLVTITSTL